MQPLRRCDHTTALPDYDTVPTVHFFLGYFDRFQQVGSETSPMFKLRSIGSRLILAISLTAAVACAILGSFSIWQQARSLPSSRSNRTAAQNCNVTACSQGSTTRSRSAP